MLQLVQREARRARRRDRLPCSARRSGDDARHDRRVRGGLRRRPEERRRPQVERRRGDRHRALADPVVQGPRACPASTTWTRWPDTPRWCSSCSAPTAPTARRTAPRRCCPDEQPARPLAPARTCRLPLIVSALVAGGRGPRAAARAGREPPGAGELPRRHPALPGGHGDRRRGGARRRAARPDPGAGHRGRRPAPGAADRRHLRLRRRGRSACWTTRSAARRAAGAGTARPSCAVRSAPGR